MTPYFRGWWRWVLAIAFGVGVGWMLAEYASASSVFTV